MKIPSWMCSKNQKIKNGKQQSKINYNKFLSVRDKNIDLHERYAALREKYVDLRERHRDQYARYVNLRARYVDLRARFKDQFEGYVDLRERYIRLRERNQEILSIGLLSPSNRYLSSCFHFAERCVFFDPATNYDLCIAHNHNSLVAAFEFSKRNQAPVIYDAVEIPQLKHAAGRASKRFRDDVMGSALIDTFEKKFIERASLICTVSQGLADWLVDHYHLPTIPLLVRNCREYEILTTQSTIRNDCSLVDGDILLLYIGQVYENQGIEQVIASLERLPYNFHLATLGPGKEDYFAELQALVEKVKIETRIHFLRPVSSTELIAYASGADIGIIPRQNSCLNNFISLPNRLFEMVMARLPIAAAGLPDIQKVVRTLNTGVVFDQTEPSSIADSILKLYRRTQEEDISGVLERAARTLSWENERQTVIDIVDRLLTGRRSGSIAIFAHKKIRSNNRIHRMCKTLTEHGYHVSVFAKDSPDYDLIVQNVDYYSAHGGL